MYQKRDIFFSILLNEQLIIIIIGRKSIQFCSFSIVQDGAEVIMSLVIIGLSYFIGCISTIGIVICLFLRYGFPRAGTIVEQEQFQTAHPLSEVNRGRAFF